MIGKCAGKFDTLSRGYYDSSRIRCLISDGWSEALE
jgi:hypothetical protein